MLLNDRLQKRCIVGLVVFGVAFALWQAFLKPAFATRQVAMTSEDFYRSQDEAFAKIATQEVPRLIDLSSEEATKVAEKAGLVIQAWIPVLTEKSSEAEKVIWQEPLPGEHVPPGYSIALSVGKKVPAS